ncbi:hypothetical protein BJ170DRAFT_685279 [Xylariales sp. AK1849]|nr:hypothetical protein BJ170DRAFT_685279 [Xylariales sp. AK1849]
MATGDHHKPPEDVGFYGLPPLSKDLCFVSRYPCLQQTAPRPSNVIVPDGDLYLAVGLDRCLLDSEYRSDSSSSDGESLPRFPRRSSPRESREHGHEEAVIFLVCSRTLARVSSVWQRLLSQKSATGQWAVRLPDDNPDAMEKILKIIHNQYDCIPAGGLMELNDIYEITILTDRYDMTHILRPWAAPWTVDMFKEVLNADEEKLKLPTYLYKHLWVAWTLGERHQFTRVHRKITRQSSITTDGYLVFASGSEHTGYPQLNEMSGPGFIEFTKELRQSFISTILDSIEDFLLGGSDKGPYWSAFQIQRQQCLQEIGLWPIPHASAIKHSPVELEKILKQNRFSLDYNFEDKGLSHSMTKHLDGQAKKTGLQGLEKRTYWTHTTEWTRAHVPSHLEWP